MRYLKSLLIVAVLALIGIWSQVGVSASPAPSFDDVAHAASGAIFLGETFHCSGTVIGTNDNGAIFLTARHCVVNPDTNAINTGMWVTFAADESGPFYAATPLLISETDDLAALFLQNGQDLPVVNLTSEYRLKSGDPIFNVSYPLDAGKLTFHGEFIVPAFPHFPHGVAKASLQWEHTMPVNLTIASGSSGSGVFDPKHKGLIGVVVGSTTEGTLNIVEPESRVVELLSHAKDNAPELWTKNHPAHPAIDWWLGGIETQ